MHLLSLLRTKNGVLLIVGWAFLWFALEKVFFGEAVYRYSTSNEGFFYYTVTLVALCLCSCFLAFCSKLTACLKEHRMLTAATGVAGSMALGILAASFQGSLDAPPAALVVCSVTYAFAFGVVFVMWSARLRELVFEHGLTNVVALSLVAIALSFVAVPSPLRFSWYGQVVVILSPAAAAAALVLTRSVLDRPGAPLPENGRAAKPVMLSLLMLAVFSFLIHLLAYVEFIAPGYIPVSDEDPYCFALLFVAILVFLAMLLFSNQNSRFWDGAFLNILVVSVILSFFVYFMVLVWSSMNATYSYALTKMLRRIIKIVAFFTVAMIVYRNDMKATPAFVFVLFLPSIASKLFQMLLSYAHPHFAGGLTQYLAAIGFLLIVCWTLFLLFHTRGIIRFSSAPQDGHFGREPEDRLPIDAFASRYGFTDRERDVLEYLSAGYSIQKISEQLFISPNTVKTHVASIYRKTDTHTKQGIIDLVHAASTDGRRRGDSSDR